MFRNYTSRLIRFWRKGIVGIERNVLIKYDTHDNDFCLRIYIRTKELKSGSSLEREREREIEFIGSSRSDNSPIIYLLHFSRQPFLYIYIYIGYKDFLSPVIRTIRPLFVRYLYDRTRITIMSYDFGRVGNEFRI